MSLSGKKIPAELCEHYRTALFDDVVPWWLRHSLDREFGGYFSLLERDGSPVWTAKANGWKGFFHLPRSLYRCYRLLAQ